MPICGWQFLLDSNQNIQRFLYSAKSVTSLVTSNDLFDMERGGYIPAWLLLYLNMCVRTQWLETKCLKLRNVKKCFFIVERKKFSTKKVKKQVVLSKNCQVLLVNVIYISRNIWQQIVWLFKLKLFFFCLSCFTAT